MQNNQQSKEIEIIFTGRIGNCLYCLLNGMYHCAKHNAKGIVFYNTPNGFDKYKKTIFRNYSKVPILHPELVKVYEAELKNLCAKNSSRVSFYTQSDIPLSFLNEFAKSVDCPDGIKNNILEKNPDIGGRVSIHVRRGDYLNYATSFYILDKNYYVDAINELEKNANERFKYLVFSDDKQWCKDNLKIENADFFEDTDPVASLYAMSMCKHNIIANSTFSQWGSFLNKNPNKLVVFPSRYNKHDTRNNMSNNKIAIPVCRKIFWKFKEE